MYHDSIHEYEWVINVFIKYLYVSQIGSNSNCWQPRLVRLGGIIIKAIDEILL